MNGPLRVLLFAGYTKASEHRKVELLANASDVEIVHLAGFGCGKAAGTHPSADGKRAYRLRLGPSYSLGRRDDPHRSFGCPPLDSFTRFRPHLIHYEGEVESLGAAEIVLLRALLAPHAKLVLTSWQNLLRPRNRAVRWLSDMNMHAAQHILCASRAAAEVLIDQGYRGGATILPIIGVDTRTFQPRPAAERRAQLGLHGFTVGYVGRLVPEKGVDDLLCAAATLAPPPNVLIVGDGPEHSALQGLAEQLGIGPRCRFLGSVPQEAVADVLALLDVLVLPSRTTTHWKEQFGRILVEAMACQVAVLGSDSGAIPEVIGDPRRIFPEGDAAALADRFRMLADDPDLLRHAAMDGYQAAVRQYSAEALAEATLTVWRNLISR